MAVAMTAVDYNAVRYDPDKRRDHVESYFIKANDDSGERALWIKATLFARAREPGRCLAEGWAIAFERRAGASRQQAVKHTLSFERAAFGKAGLDVHWSGGLEAGGAEKDAVALCASPGAASGTARGAITTGERQIAWDLRFSGEPRPIVLLPSPKLYETALPSSKLVTPYPDLRFEGEVTAFGERWNVDGWRGMQGHNWGRGHAELYAWCHGNVWNEDPEFVVEGVSARVRMGPLLTPLTTLVCVRHRGVVYDFNRPADVVRARGDVGMRSWSFSAKTRHATIEGVVDAEGDDMVGLYYANPSSPMTHCLNTKLARARIRFEADGRPPLLLTSAAAALEVGTTNADHGVRMHV
jgi:hypothetical protein